MAYSPAQIRVARQIAAAAPGTDLDALLVATAMAESNLTPTAVGDGGRSHGLFQEYDLGRGAGIPISGRRDVGASTLRAFREFQTFRQRGASGPELAYRAQRPADRAGYIAKIGRYLPQAMALIGAGEDPATERRSSPRRAGAAMPDAPAAAGAGSQVALLALQAIDEIDSGGVNPATLLQLAGAQQSARAPQAPSGPRTAAERGGQHHQGDGHDHSGDPAVPLLPGAPQWGSYGYGDPEGQGGKHLAVDWFASPTTAARAPVAGRIVRLDPHSSAGGPASGQVYGGTLGIRDAQGRLLVMRHIDPNARLRVGMSVRPGQVIGTPTDWTGSDHIHSETYRRGSSDREYRPEYAINPRDYFRSLGLFR